MAFYGGKKSGGSGESAYQIAVKNGFEGTESEWVAAMFQGPRETFDQPTEPQTAETGDVWITGE